MIAKNKSLQRGWREVRLGEVCSINKKTLSSKTPDDYCFDYIALSDVDRGNLLQTKKYKFSEVPSRARRVVEQGDVLLGTVRPNLQGFYVFKNEVTNCIVSTGFAVLTPKPNLLDSVYLFQLLFSHQMLATYYAVNVGSNYPAINSSDIPNFKILIPPLPEQKAIAALLEKWDTTIEKTEALIEAKEKRFKWLLKTLISDQQDNPEWQQVKLAEVGVIHSGGTPSTRDSSNWNGDFLWLTPSAVTRLSEKYINSTERQITRKRLSHTTLLPKNCLIVCTRATIGDCCINTVPMAINQGFKCIQPHRHYSVTFLYYTFQLLKTRLIRLSCGNTFGEVSKKDFANILISIPPFFEQKTTAAHLDTAQQEIYLLKQLAEQYRTQKRGLMQKLLTGEWRVKEEKISCRT